MNALNADRVSPFRNIPRDGSTKRGVKNRKFQIPFCNCVHDNDSGYVVGREFAPDYMSTGNLGTRSGYVININFFSQAIIK